MNPNSMQLGYLIKGKEQDRDEKRQWEGHVRTQPGDRICKSAVSEEETFRRKLPEL